MNNTDRILHRAKQATYILIAALVVLTMMQMYHVVAIAESGQEESNDHPDIVVEVVEEIPAADIEEQAVPLAAGPESDSDNMMRHALMMGGVLAGTIAYALFFCGYERRLSGLRLKAAEAESKAAAIRRGRNG